MLTKSFFATIFIMYCVICLLLFIFQRHFIYAPSKYIANFSDYNLKDFKEITLSTKDNHKIIGWYKNAKNSKPTIVFFHGNAGNISHRIYKLLAFTNDSGYGLLGVDYRGYGGSKGKPTERGLYNDGRAAIDYLKLQNIPEDEMIFYGESLGTAVAVKMATEYKPKLLVLEAPFTSAVNLGNEGIFRLFPITLLLKDKFNSLAAINKINSPVLIAHGKSDGIINVSHGQQLYKAANTKKQLVLYEGKGHNNIDPFEVLHQIMSFNYL